MTGGCVLLPKRKLTRQAFCMSELDERVRLRNGEDATPSGQKSESYER
jgi:hypothetical protein